MTSAGSIRENLTWAGTVAAGAWLSMQVARWRVDMTISSGVVDGAREPVREIVEEVLDAHRSEETPMVPAFETALEQDRTEDRA